nr:hypothetical protein [Bacteroidota bacterium]
MIYVAAMRYEPPAIVSSHIYRATYDPSNGNINANSWTDVSNFMHNKAVIAMSTNGRSVQRICLCLPARVRRLDIRFATRYRKSNYSSRL